MRVRVSGLLVAVRMRKYSLRQAQQARRVWMMSVLEWKAQRALVLALAVFSCQ